MAKIPKEWVEAYFEYGVDIANRRVFLFDTVDEDSIAAVIKGLYFMDSQSSFKTVGGKKTRYKKPIELFIGSFGGSEYEMFALYDVTRTLTSPIHTVAIGKCMSAAPLLVVAGEKGHRYATPNTWFMIHDSYDDPGEKRVQELKKDIAHYDQMSKRWYELMAKHTKKDVKFWRDHVAKVGDVFFDAYQAEEWGLVDQIWDEKEGI